MMHNPVNKWSMASVGLPDLRVFTPEQINLLTAYFSQENCIVHSSVCKLYRGWIPGGLNGMQEQEVTVKVWEGCAPTHQEKKLWLALELHILQDPRVNACKNLPKLVGYSDTAELVAVVYGLCPLGMLHDLITDRDDFNWLKRIKVALGLASFLESLHGIEGSQLLQLPDFDASHILIDKDFQPLMVHLGLPSCGVDGVSAGCRRHNLPSGYSAACASTPFPGLAGWSEKSDVYSFGTVLLSLIAKTAVPKQNLARPAIVEWAKKKYIRQPLLYGEDTSCSLVHHSLEEDPFYDAMDGSKVTNLAMRCENKNPEKRPKVKEIVQLLRALRLFQIHTLALDTTLGFIPRMFTPEQLKHMTSNYRQENLIGHSQFGKLYRGEMPSNTDGAEAQAVIVKIWADPPTRWRLHPHAKRLSLANEVYFLQQPDIRMHPNLVELVGYCVTSDVLAVVYRLDPWDTLENVLMRDGFTWQQRVKVALQLARLLAFLHDRQAQYIIRNIDAAHILLDKDYNPVVFEFGLLTGGVLGDFTTAPHQRVFGSPGYADPHVGHTGLWSDKCDVYSYAIVLLSLISKRVPDRRGVEHMDLWAEQECRRRKVSWLLGKSSLVHVNLKQEPTYKPLDGSRITNMVMRCLKYRPHSRPKIEQVVEMLQDLSIIRVAGVSPLVDLNVDNIQYSHSGVSVPETKRLLWKLWCSGGGNTHAARVGV